MNRKYLEKQPTYKLYIAETISILQSMQNMEDFTEIDNAAKLVDIHIKLIRLQADFARMEKEENIIILDSHRRDRKDSLIERLLTEHTDYGFMKI